MNTPIYRIALMLAASLATTVQSATNYDVQRDFSVGSNPNGVWSYGYYASVGGTFTLMNTARTNERPSVPIWSWSVGGFSPPDVHFNAGTNTYMSDGGTFPPGSLWICPGPEGTTRNYGVMRFTVPPGGAGNYRVETAVQPYIDGPLDGDSDFHVARNGVELFGMFLAAHSATGYTNQLVLGAGDTVDFVIGRGQDGLLAGSCLKLRAVLTPAATAPSPGDCVNSPSGLISWWRGEGTPNDQVGTNHAVLRNGTGYAMGLVGRGFQFDGTNDDLMVAQSPSLDLTNEFTIELWFRKDQPWVPNVQFVLFDKRDLSGHLNYGASLSVNYGLILYYQDPSAGGFQILSHNPLPTTNVFHHFAGVYRQVDAGHVQLQSYLDGQQVAIGQFPGNLANSVTSSPLTIGSARGCCDFFRGVLDEISIYRRALTTGEVATLFAAGSAGKCASNLPPVLAPSHLRWGDVPALAGSTVLMPLEIAARGDENAFSFSLEFNPSLLSFRTVSSTAPAGTTLIVNSNDAGAGRIGIVLALPASTTLPAGTQQLVRVEFQAGNVIGPAPVSFSGSPVSKQVADAFGHSIPADYAPGTVTIMPGGFEADIAPRPGGDGAIQAIDLVLIGRFAANLDTPSPGEFARVDCAPRATGGNGVISAADFVQAARYVAALDPATPTGGPLAPVAGFAAFRPAANTPRVVRVSDAMVVSNSVLTLPLTLEAQGDENALGFSIEFDPGKLTLLGVASGSDAMFASMNLNWNSSGNGKLGCLIALPAGQTFIAGKSEVLRLSFQPADTAAGNGAVAFGDEPVLREVVNANAESQAAHFVSGTVAFAIRRPSLSVIRSGDSLVLAWPNSDSAFHLEGTSGPLPAAWELIPSFVLGAQSMAVVPCNSGQRFFRLKSP